MDLFSYNEETEEHLLGFTGWQATVGVSQKCKIKRSL